MGNQKYFCAQSEASIYRATFMIFLYGVYLQARLFPQRRKKFSCMSLASAGFLQFDLLRAVVFQLNLKHLQVKITNLLRVVV